MSRKILLITTDQMRHDALGCNGGVVARTPVIDALARNGINYERAHNQNVVCMPARATIITGQYVATHGVWMNGVSLPERRRRSRIGCHNMVTAPDCSERRTSNRGSARRRPSTKTGWRDWERPVHIAASNGWNSPTTSICVTRTTTCGWSRTIPRRSGASIRWLPRKGCRTRKAAARRARSRSGTIRYRARCITPTGWRIGPSRGSTRCPPMRTGSSGSAFPIRTIRGIRPRRNGHVSIGATYRYRSCIPATRQRRRNGSQASRVIGKPTSTDRYGRTSSRHAVSGRAI